MVEITSSPDQEAAEGETPLTGPQRQTDSRVAAGKTAALTGGNLRLRRGLLGSAFAAICCFTPLLVVILAGAGLSAIVGWLDYALFPMLFASLGVVAHACRHARARGQGRDGVGPIGYALASAV